MSGPAGRGRALRVVSTVDALAASLRDRILSGEFPAGASLREVQLATEYGVGRHSLRAAFASLVHEGLLTFAPHRGVSIPHLSGQDVRDIHRLRSALETEAVRALLASRRGCPPEAWKQVAAMEALPDGVPWAAVVDADLGLHQALVDAVDSPRLSRAYGSLAAEMRLCLAQLRPHYRAPREIAAEHRALLEAIDSRDQRRATRATRSHLTRAVHDLTSAGDPSRLGQLGT